MSRYTLDIVVKGHDRASKPLGNVSNALSGLGRVGLVGLGVGLAAVGVGIAKMVSDGVGAASMLQDLELALTTLVGREKVIAGEFDNVAQALGSATPVAKDLMDQLRDLSLESPFEYQQVADAMRLQMAYGATSDMAIDLTKAVLDTGAALGLSSDMLDRMNYNLAQAIMQGDLTSVNFRDLKRVGLDLAGVLEGELGMSIEGIRDGLETGKLTMKDVSQAFMDYAETNFGGASERMSRTFSGLKSSFNDLFFFAGAGLFRPALEEVTKVLGGMFDKVRGFLDEGGFAQLGEQLGEVVRLLLAGDIEGLTETLGLSPEVAEFIRNVAGDLGRLADTITTGIGKAFDWLADNVLPKLNEGLGFINDNWEVFSAAIAGAAAALAGATIAGMLIVIVGALNPVILGIAAIGAAVAVLVKGWQKDWGGIRSTAEKVSGALQKAFGKLEPVFEVVEKLVEGVKAAFEEGGLEAAVQRFKDIWPALQVIVGLSVKTILEEIGQAFGVDLLAIFEDVKGDIADVVADIWEPFQVAWEVVQGVIEAVIAVVGPAIGEFVESIKGSLGSFEPVIEAFKGLWTALQPVIQVAMVALGAIVVTAIGLIVSVFQGLAGAIGPIIQGLAGIITGIVNVVTGVVEVLTGLVTGIVALFQGDTEKMTEAWEKMKEGIGKIVEGLVTAIVSAIGGLVGGVYELLSGFIDGIIKFFTTLRDKLVGNSIIPDMINEILKWFGEMPGKIVATVSKQLGALVELGKGIVESIKQGIMSAWDNFVSWLSGQIGGLIDAMLKAAGFGSPSKPLMEMGRNMVSSIQLGWEKQFGALKNQLTADMGGLTMSGLAFAGAAGGEMGSTAYTTHTAHVGGDTITFNINDQNSMALALAMVEDRRAERLNAFMGG